MKESITYNVLHICDFAAQYPGNFIASLESLEKYHDNVKNFYLFPAKTRNTVAEKWILAMNDDKEVAYIQENNMFGTALLLLNIIKRNKINRIVRHFSDKKIDILLKVLFDSKKIIRFFHCDCRPDKNILKQKIKEFVFRNNTLVGVSNVTANRVKSVFPGSSVFSIVNAINFERLDQIDKFEKADGISLFMLAWDYKTKGADLAIKVVNDLRKKYNLVLHFVCGENEPKVKALAKEILGTDVDWIRFLPSTNNIGTYYHANDIFLSPSRHEAFGYANIEAVYCKNSIVLSKVDGQAELQIEGAYWIESDNIADFTQKLEQAILERNLPDKIAQRERAKEQVVQIYSLQEWSNRVVDIF